MSYVAEGMIEELYILYMSGTGLFRTFSTRKVLKLLTFWPSINKLSSNGGIEGNQFAQLQITGFGELGACANWLPAGGQCRERHGAH